MAPHSYPFRFVVVALAGWINQQQREVIDYLHRSRAALQIEILALRYQLGVLHRSARTRPRLTPADRML